MIALRPYQAELVSRVGDAFAHHKRAVVMLMPTGGGKTATASNIIVRAVAKQKRVVFAAHLDALIDDTSERLTQAGIPHGIVQGGRPSDPTQPVQVASLATLHRRGEAPPADLAIIDECHRAMSSSVRGVIDRYPTAKILGLTATPQRGDGKPLGDVFDALVCGPTPSDLLALGHLVACEVLSPPCPTPGTLAMDPADAYAVHALHAQRGLVFCATLAEAADVVERLPVPARLFTGEQSATERREVLAAFRAGDVRVLVGCTAFLEGFDVPAIDAVISARAMGTASAWLQGCGRGLRAAPGKTRCVIVDLTGAAFEHGLPYDARTWSIEGPPVRTGAALTPIMRCTHCLAVFHVAIVCPRCGASTRGAVRARHLTRVEAQELRRVDTMPQAQRDAIALRGIEKRLLASGKFSPDRVRTIALNILARKRLKKETAA